MQGSSLQESAGEPEQDCAEQASSGKRARLDPLGVPDTSCSSFPPLPALPDCSQPEKPRPGLLPLHPKSAAVPRPVLAGPRLQPPHDLLKPASVEPLSRPVFPKGWRRVRVPEASAPAPAAVASVLHKSMPARLDSSARVNRPLPPDLPLPVGPNRSSGSRV